MVPREKPEPLIKISDPEGFTVILDADTWENHIKLRHPEMVNLLGELQETIKQPISIHSEYRWPSTCHYYGKMGDLFLLVVVERNASELSGRVRTAHLLKKLRKGIYQTWQRG
jgi:hypothetical protein